MLCFAVLCVSGAAGTRTGNPEKFKADWQPAKVKMRLALGFCGHVAKTAFSSLSARKLEAGHRVEVKLRRTLCCPGVSPFVCLFLRGGSHAACLSLNRLAWPC